MLKVEGAQVVIDEVVTELREVMDENMIEMKKSVEQQNRGIRDRKPKKGYQSISNLCKTSHVSRKVVDHILNLELEGESIREDSGCSFYDPDANGHHFYTAYNKSDFKMFEKAFLLESTRINETQYEHHTYNGRFKIKTK